MARPSWSRCVPLLKRFWALLLVGHSACNLVVDTDYLVAGKDGLECSEEEKICPVSSDEPDDVSTCVGVTNPETGCANKSCSPCQLPGAVARCLSGGGCGIAVCSDRNEDCDKDESNGCEIDTESSLDNCGACGQPCTRPNAATSCVKGVCEFVICSPPFADCDKSFKNGCEVNLDDDRDHCGDCDTQCPGSCVNGACQP